MKNECSLCGGKLKNGICTECGMNNKKSDKMYAHILNQGDCKQKNLTHVHKEDKAEEYRKPVMNKNRQTQEQKGNQTDRPKMPGSYRPRTYASMPFDGKKRRDGYGIMSIVSAIAAIIGILIVFISQHAVSSNIAVPEPDYWAEEYIEMEPDGEVWEQKLEAGVYQVGVDLPEGEYTIQGPEGTSFQSSDMEHGLFYAETFRVDSKMGKITESSGKLLYAGAIVYVDGMQPAVFRTENGQVEDMEPRMENPVQAKTEITGRKTAGKDFPAGTYDIEIQGDDFGILKYEIPNGESPYGHSFEVLMEGNPTADNPQYCKIYKNVVLPEGAVIDTAEFTVLLIPSEGITTDDYQSFYDNMM